MILGFTGTSKGMTQRQRATVRYLLGELQVTELHHGDCVGADAEVHELGRELSLRVIVHPPSDSKHRAFCGLNGRSLNYILDPRPYLVRNRDIVAASIDGIIGAPKDFIQPKSLRRQGTWTTVGYARQAGRHLWLVFPDGTFREDNKVK